jgi:non-specific serine/threonine protein kinase
VNDTSNAQRLSATFVGRARERARLARLTASHPVVTVIGPAGVGKTRLVAEAIRGWDRRFRGGRWWIDLASIAEPELVARFIADQLGLRQPVSTDLPAALARRVGGQRALLVLDNCEHLLEAVANTISGLVTAPAGLAVLATSREPLGIVGTLPMQRRPRRRGQCARLARPPSLPESP